MTSERDGTTNGFQSLMKGKVMHRPKYKHGLRRNASDTFIAYDGSVLTVQGMSATLGQAIRTARKARKKSMAQVASAVGVSTAAVQQWETGGTSPTPENLTAAARYLEIDPRDLLALLARLDLPEPGEASRSDLSRHEPAPNAIIEAEAPQLPVGGPRDIEELGIAMGGEGDEDEFEFNGQVVDRVTRPPGILHRRDVFSLRVFSTSMVPKFEHNERIFAERRRPGPGEYAVIELYPREEGGAVRGYIKRFLSMNSEVVTVEQFNPQKEIRFRRHEVRAVHRVIPWNELLGV